MWGGIGTVTIWYDQSGNGNNVIQTTPGLQPVIVTNGVIYRNNCQPSVYFNSKYLKNNSGFPSGSDYTVNAVVNQTVSGGGNVVGTATTGNHTFTYNSTTNMY